jgi:cyclopropane-fatty-acyl-phospholipid synthase
VFLLAGADRVVSVEMFEHMRNWRELLRRIAGWLRPGGKLLFHVFCHREMAYEFQAGGTTDWIGRNFFTGGIMPADDLALHFQQDLRAEAQWRWNGSHYADTANAWLANLDHERARLLPILEETYGREAERWHQRWRMFFMACAELFAFDRGEQWWVTHHRMIRPDDTAV